MLIGSGRMVGAARSLVVLALAAGFSVLAACTSGSTANCSPDEGGTPNTTAWCGVPAGDASEVPETSGPMETGAGDAAQDTGGGGPDTGAGMDAAPETGQPETGSSEAAADAPAG